ncbi:MAG: hypothetical protein AB8D52_07585 [Gammaproteobacteria bacterium]
MPKFSVLLEGQNFPLVLDDETKLYGFYVTRKVLANDQKEAELAAVNSVKNDQKLLSTIDREYDAEPRLFMESIHKLHWWSRLNVTGYSFYPMDSE